MLSKLLVLWNICRFRYLGVSFGKHLRIYGHLGLRVHGTFKVGKYFTCNSGTMENAMGRNVRSFIRVNESASLLIGSNTGMSSSCIRCSNSIKIGDNVKIGALTIITDTDAHSLDYKLRRDPYTDARNAKSSPVIIEDDVFIGASSIICKGVTIGARSIIGAGSVVTRSIPSDEVWAGNPARFIRSLK